MGKFKIKWWHLLILGAFLISIIYTLIQRKGEIPEVPSLNPAQCASGYYCYHQFSDDCFMLYGYPDDPTIEGPCYYDSQCINVPTKISGLYTPNNAICCDDVRECGIAR